ncbi:hydrolase TatD [Alkalilimnicola ehrlichii]|uniref:Hydrolase TatD n=2 Tax=Alkalilimnicola ehrlichii TaxID=351052 RepID=A0A3E0WIF9_9GAMM|nr:hydrolase TatD [Alkalilimnicola ehrlichii]RFA31655.1 hydrolase TatD [Alkalilimnicola ehrlichii]
METAALELFDIGVNLTNKAFRKDLDEVLARSWAAGLTGMAITGTSVAASEAALELAQRDPQRLYATAGVHPHEASQYDSDAHQRIRTLAGEAGVVAIGETGLDFNRDFSPRPAQEQAFERQLELACELSLPVFLHQRDAHERFIAILKAYRDALPAAVLHCFTGTREELWASLDLDLYIGITGWICDERRGLSLQDCVGDIPTARLVIETDAPYLTPRTLKPKPKAGRNEPAFLPEVLQAVSRCRNADPAQLAHQTTANARQLFRI